MKDFNYKKYLPYALAVAIFAVLTLMYFAPITEGYELRQDDLDNYKGMSKEIHDYRKFYDQDPLWTNSMFGGMPAYQIDVQHKGNILRTIDRILQLGFPGVIGYFFLLFIGFYILMLCLKVDPWLAVVGSIAYAFSTFFILIVWIGHNTQVHALAYMPAVLGGFILTLRGRMFQGAAVFTFFFALELFSNHVQVTYYLFIVLLTVGITEFVLLLINKGNILQFLLRTGLIVAGVGVGVFANSGNLWNTYEYGMDTTRGPSELHIAGDGKVAAPDAALDPEYITRWSYGRDETWNLIFPNAKGGNGGFIGNMEEFKAPGTISPANKQQIINEAIQYQETRGQQGHLFSKYWGNQPGTGGPTYIGAAVVFLFVLSFVFVNDKLKWGILAVSVLAILLAWGHNLMGFTEFFIDHFPGYGKFRSVTMILVIVQMTMPLMAVLLVKEIVQNPDTFKQQEKKFLMASGITFGILLVVTLLPGLFMDFLSQSDMSYFNNSNLPDAAGMKNEIISFRESIFRADAMRSLFIIALTFLALFAFIKNWINKNIAVAGLAVIVFADLYLVDRGYLNNDQEKGQYVYWVKSGTYPFMPGNADIDILQSEMQLNPDIMKDAEQFRMKVEKKKTTTDQQIAELIEAVFPALNFNTDYRVLEIGDPFNSSATSYFHKSIGGYHGAKLKRYQELIEFAIQREHNRVVGMVQQMMQSGVPAEKLTAVYAMTGAAQQTQVLNMLNTRYIIVNSQLPALPNPGAAGSAWFAKSVRWADNADQEILAVANLRVTDTVERETEGKKARYAEFEYTQHNIVDTVIIDKRFEANVQAFTSPDSAAFIRQTFYSPRQLTYETNNSKDGFAVFSEIYYNKGWKAKIDGQPAEHVRVNYVLRGMNIPAGTHQVEFVFEPDSFKTMETVNMLGNILVLLLVGALLYLDYRKNKSVAA